MSHLLLSSLASTSCKTPHTCVLSFSACLRKLPLGMCFFFFSSRRRHTRYWRDWSSDVCSSDLTGCVLSRGVPTGGWVELYPRLAIVGTGGREHRAGPACDRHRRARGFPVVAPTFCGRPPFSGGRAPPEDRDSSRARRPCSPSAGPPCDRHRGPRGSLVFAPTLSASHALSAVRSRQEVRTSSSARRSCSQSAGSQCLVAYSDLCRSRSARSPSGSKPEGTRTRRSPSMDHPAAASRSTSAWSRGPCTSSATARRYRATWSDSSRQHPPATISPSADTCTYQAPAPRPAGFTTAPWWVLYGVLSLLKRTSR